MMSKFCIKAISFLSFLMLVTSYPNPLSEIQADTSNAGESLSVRLLTRPLEEETNFLLTTSLLENNPALADNAALYDENPNDLELAEVNVFRPVFRYRVVKKVKGPQQF